MVLSVGAHAADFESRVANGKAAAATPEGENYEASLGPIIGGAMQACIAIGSKEIANLGKFIVVGNVSATGSLVEVDFNPNTAVSRCFAEKLQGQRLPKPPGTSTLSAGFPIQVTLSVVP